MSKASSTEKTFTERVLDAVRAVPAGETRSYAEIAHLAGSPQAARSVGSIMKANTDLSVPCHRVIRSDGTLGAYNGIRGQSKESLLQAERTGA
ncbi:hypothetical protein A3C89_01090 [Candidatus Kaiserbacteria bacterium RIFCSPHIGHO2_02_FULL_50_50]|uniref:Methylated-DNA-[protein]-cysteine S-methyltransferase DNA binding domain-containing protein n=1 Tax=Candidatus Kaiserbacteria bacterium RIFCSPHIGHO2_02_FULL_50_50 TaxID=1798492 RepID=A0A1F6DDZ2_9BACT|nr:MAG: hypothetical protein A3C89_01090 [Candidatus Kaiserbacteria bacterium RIFCSPHIGHO2_02_FULL_50_50]OGG88717.1 MAG: hypothetical protein A3G62_00490 [Candidatus Kaiserbacteria bacterium RIFCSPLOWO2_12_FULL_50_10]